MKFFFVLILSLSSVSIWAETHGDKNWDKLPFEEQKQMRLKTLDKNAAMIESTRSCVKEAKDKDALKNCYQEMRDQKKAMRAEWKNKKKQAQEDILEVKESEFNLLEDDE